jgi:hypothetical protein
LGSEQEEQIREICEAEKECWRHRPGMKKMRSLAKPMTETRHRIREVLLVGEENWWRNPKSGAREHIALKYMNFSTEEWTQMAQPREVWIVNLQESGTGFAGERWVVCKRAEAVLQQSKQFCSRARAKRDPLGAALNEIHTRIETHRNASKRIETHRNASKRIETHRNASKRIETHRNASKRWRCIPLW